MFTICKAYNHVKHVLLVHSKDFNLLKGLSLKVMKHREINFFFAGNFGN